MHRHSLTFALFALPISTACVIVVEENETIGDETGDTSSGDGDGDVDSAGDGDDDDSGDGDGDSTGDGDGDSAGDGDGDSGDGDGDGDPSLCGDGVIQGNEECDHGLGNSDSGHCTTSCEIAFCGDGLVHAGAEECDDANQDATDDCVTGCMIASCGDGYVHAGAEECDDANQDETDDCNQLCMFTSCGDGILQAGEQCDDGNQDLTDACPACSPAVCGDGFVQAGNEACDDGNQDSFDACIYPSCSVNVCGDGVLYEGQEECDDGNPWAGDACTNGCTAAVCGDGVVQVHVEECDDGNDVDDDECSNACMDPPNKYIFLNSANDVANETIYRYSIVDDEWQPETSTSTNANLTNDGESLFVMRDNNTVMAYNVAHQSWSVPLMLGPGPMTEQGGARFEWFPDGFYWYKNETSTMYVWRDDQWTSFELGSEASPAASYDYDNSELYIRTYAQFGFTVVDSDTDTVVRTIVDPTFLDEFSRIGSYVDGYFYTRTGNQPLVRFDAFTGTKTNLPVIPPFDIEASATDFATGLIYFFGCDDYGVGDASFVVYDPIADELTALDSQPTTCIQASITVMRY